MHWTWQVPANHFAAGFAILVVIYFWWQNIIGIHESSEKALRIMQITSVMVVMLLIWCAVTIAIKGFNPVPFPTRATIHFSQSATGWLRGTIAPSITVIAITIGLGHSLLAMSGFETLAQVYRELAHPKLENLKKSAFVIILYSLLFTALVSFFAVMIIPDAERGKYLDNLIGGLSMFLVGPTIAKLLFHVFVVVVGALILSGACNTAIIGSNGVLNRVAEDGVLPEWFRKPHARFGTTSRLINLFVGMQIATIVISGGDMIMLGEAYAFGVVWSFALKALSVLVLRFKLKETRGYKVPFNIRVGKIELPIGLAMITAALFTLAVVNVLTKEIATISGVCFSLAFFALFAITEHYNRKRLQGEHHELEQFRLDSSENISRGSLHVRPGSILVAVRNPHHLEHVQKTLEKTDTRKVDIVAVSVHRLSQAASGEHDIGAGQIFSSPETEVFTRVVSLAEKAGKHVELLAVAATDPWLAILQTAQRLESARIVTGLSPRYEFNPAEQGKVFGEAWEKLETPRPSISLEVVLKDPRNSLYYNLGPHPPRLWPEDVDLVHRLWRELTEQGLGSRLRHRDVVGVALRRLDRDLHSRQEGEVLNDFAQEVAEHLNQQHSLAQSETTIDAQG